MERSPWHAGEQQLQAHVGVAERMEAFGRKVIRDWMPDQHRAFYEQLPFMLYGAVDTDGRPWASVLEGAPGFAHSPDPEHLHFASQPAADDPAQLRNGEPIGLLGIELHTRRRNRLNGHVDNLTVQGFEVSVDQAFGNCPQYIQLRQFQRVPLSDPQTRPAQHDDGLDDAARAMIEGADTFFVASYVDADGQRAVDVSHRGGQTGFVRVEGNRLTIPDFAGNLHFNTLGNLLLNPKAGLLFIDFSTGDVLQLSGRTEIILDGPQIEAFQGAERLWTFEVERLVRRPAALALRWRFDGMSPTSLLTGNWAQADARLQAKALGDRWRPLRVTRIERESQHIRSIYLQPDDGAGMPVFQAGQHLPLRFTLDGETHIRTYSLSSAPSDDFLRISVKREGLVSGHLHQQIRVGDVLEARAPQGHFTVAPLEHRPLVLLAAGVGITPLLSMLREVVYQGLRTRRIRPTWLLQSSRSLADQPFREEIDRVLESAGDAVRVIRLLSQPEADVHEGEDFDRHGRIDRHCCVICWRSRITTRSILLSVGPALLPKVSTTVCASWTFATRGSMPRPSARRRSSASRTRMRRSSSNHRPPSLSAGDVRAFCQRGALAAGRRQSAGARREPWPAPRVQLPWRFVRHLQDTSCQWRGELSTAPGRPAGSGAGADLLRGAGAE